MKTQFLKINIEKISSLNDQLWFYLFAIEELNKDFKRFSDHAKSLYTSDLFKDNPHSCRIDIPVVKLPKHQKDNQNITLGIYFATCYEILAQYIKNIYDTLKSFNSITYTTNPRKGLEENLQIMIVTNGLTPIKLEIINTIKYLRLRRNHFTHIIESANPSLANFKMSICPSLNMFWQGRSTISKLDFTKSLIRDFGVEETFELIKLIRICLQEVDNHIALLLNINSVITDLIKRYKNSNNEKFKRIPLSRKVKKIKSEALFSLDRVLTDADILPFL